MSEDAGSAGAAYSTRAGFWQRAVAFGIDLLLINVLIAGIGLAAVGLTGGKMRVASIPADVVDCIASAPPPLDGFEGATARRCTRSVLGTAHDWTLVVRGNATADEENRRQVSIPLDAEGHLVHAFYLDALLPLVLAAYFFLLEWRLGATLGKRIIGLSVRSLNGGPISPVQACKRLLRMIILLPPSTTPHLLPGPSTESHRITFGLSTSYGIPDLGIWSDVLGVAAFAYLIGFIVTTSRRTLPLHDRWAKTEVVRYRLGPEKFCNLLS